MNDTKRKISMIVVLVLVIVFGFGQFFAGSGLNVNQNQNQNQNQVPTQVIAFAPSALASSTPVKAGSCFANSVAAPYRADAWRCSVGNMISDPCFAIPGSKNLACKLDPVTGSVSSTFILSLTKPLPKPEIITDASSSRGFLVQLADGTVCAPMTGTLPPVLMNNQTVSFACAPGDLGNSVYVFGPLNNASSVWTAQVALLSISTSGPPTIAASGTFPIYAVWQ